MKILRRNLLLLFFILIGIIWRALTWEMAAYFSVFSFPVINIAVWAVLLTSLVLTVLVPAFRKSVMRGVVSLLLCGLLLIPVDAVYENIRFWILSPDMEKAAYEVLLVYADGTREAAYNLSLPAEQQRLSRSGGDVNYYDNGTERMVFFYSYRGVGESKGYYFFEEPIDPAIVTPAFFGDGCRKAEIKSPRWVYTEFV